MPTFPQKIILTGFRATGKTTVGKLLAGELGLAFMDMDQELVQRHGPINAMVAAKGWPFFRQKERELLAELVERTGIVIATGGGTIMHSELWGRLKQTGLVVWLSAPEAEIRHRMQNDGATSAQRPALTGQDVMQEVALLLKEREPLYRAGSHLQLDTSTASPRELVTQILEHLRSEHGG
jgi:shikimate kinase